MCISWVYVVQVGLTYITRRTTGEVQTMGGVKEVIDFYLPYDTVRL